MRRCAAVCRWCYMLGGCPLTEFCSRSSSRMKPWSGSPACGMGGARGRLAGAACGQHAVAREDGHFATLMRRLNITLKDSGLHYRGKPGAHLGALCRMPARTFSRRCEAAALRAAPETDNRPTAARPFLARLFKRAQRPGLLAAVMWVWSKDGRAAEEVGVGRWS